MLNRIIIRVLLLFLGVGSIFAQGKLETESEAVTETLKSYAAAVESKNMQEIEKHVATSEDFTMFEGGHINWGWQDYRDHHLAPELKAFLEFHYNFEDIRAHVMGD
ncbi:MAG: hypothetical protein ACE5G1_07825, partial [bacterium]